MKKLTTLILLFYCLVSCIQIETRDMSGKRKTNNPDNKEISTLPDSVIQIEEKKAIGNIMFGVNKKQFEQEEKKFLKGVKIVDSYDYHLEEYEFYDITPKFHEGKLFFIELHGSPLGNISKQYTALYELLKTKYNEPHVKLPIPDLQLLKNREFLLASWNIGKKTIEIRLYSYNGYNYSIRLYSYLPEIEKLANKQKEEMEQKEKKESRSKAIEVL